MEDAIDKSCRYDHRGGCTEHCEQLDWLSCDLKREIEKDADNILALERLQERYFDALEEAQRNNDMGRVIRYSKAHNHVNVLLDQLYRKHRPVGNDGKQK